MKLRWKLFGIAMVVTLLAILALSSMGARMSLLPVKKDNGGWTSVVVPVGTYTTVDGASFKLMLSQNGATLSLVEPISGLFSTNATTTDSEATGAELTGSSISIRPISMSYVNDTYWVFAKAKAYSSLLTRQISTTKLGEWLGMMQSGNAPQLSLTPQSSGGGEYIKLPYTLIFRYIVMDSTSSSPVSGAVINLKFTDTRGSQVSSVTSNPTDSSGKVDVPLWIPAASGHFYETVHRTGYSDYNYDTAWIYNSQAPVLIYSNPMAVPLSPSGSQTSDVWTSPYGDGVTFPITDTSDILAYLASHLKTQFQTVLQSSLDNQSKFFTDIINLVRTKSENDVLSLIENINMLGANTQQLEAAFHELYSDVMDYISFNDNKTNWILGKLLSPKASVSVIASPILYSGVPNLIALSPNFCNITRVVVSDRSGKIYDSGDVSIGTLTTISVTPKDGDTAQVQIDSEVGANAQSPTSENSFPTSRTFVVAHVAGGGSGGVYDENLPFGLTTIDLLIIVVVSFVALGAAIVIYTVKKKRKS